MITAEELLDNIEIWDGVFVHSENAKQAMIEFAKLYVKAALKEASENILYKELSVDWETFNHSGMLFLDDEGIEDFKNSILNSYSLDKIK